MPTTLKAGRLAGIPIEINVSVLGVAFFVVWTIAFQILPRVEPEAAVGLRLLAAITCALLFFVSILGHELGHALVARRHGVQATAITLWLLGGVAKLVRQAPNPKAEFQIAAAGPLASALLGIGFGALAALNSRFLDWRLTFVVMAWLGAVNLLLAVSNLLPAAPLDGGRVLTAAIWKRIGDAEKARLISARCGLILGAGLSVAAVIALVWQRSLTFGWISTFVMGVFLLVAARAEIAGAAIRGRMARTLISQLMTTHPKPVQDSQTIDQFLLTTPPGGFNVAQPVLRWDHRPIGYIVPAHAAEITGAERSWSDISSVMIRPDHAARAWSNETVEQVVDRLDLDTKAVIVVHDPVTGSEIGTMSDGQLRTVLVYPDTWGRLPEMDAASSGPHQSPLVGQQG